MFLRYVFVCGFILFSFVVHTAQASVSMAVPVCSVKGVVLSESIREAVGRGISEGRIFKYHDVKINVFENHIASEDDKAVYPDYTDCDFIGEKTYQKQGGVTQNKGVLIGQCIQAKTNISGDGNFQFGNWIYDIEILPVESCQED